MKVKATVSEVSTNSWFTRPQGIAESHRLQAPAVDIQLEAGPEGKFRMTVTKAEWELLGKPTLGDELTIEVSKA